jgi:hypothetical protein
MGVLSMEYMTAQEAAEKWGITKRRVQILCSENRIEGVQRLGNMWAIPKDTQKPVDGRSLRYVDKEVQE